MSVNAITTLPLSESDRQLVLMALAHLAVERPGWREALRLISEPIDNPAPRSLFDEFHRERYPRS